jgi:arabinofuranosyltransferase
MTNIYMLPDSTSGTRPVGRAVPVLAGAIAASFVISSVLLSGFTAEDAYILFRYVENIHDLGAWVYNDGERINSLTSPLHAVVMTALFTVTRECVVTGKVLGLVMTVLSAVLAWRRYRTDPLLAALGLALMVLPSNVVLWTFGGLETPLLGFLAAGAVLLMTAQPAKAHVYGVCFIGGLGFLARYDAALFFAPLALHALWKEPTWRHRLGAAALGAAAPLLWLAVARLYFGDIFPTSFYIKPPVLAAPVFLRNAAYIGIWLVLCGVVPAGLAWLTSGPRLRATLASLSTAHWAVIAGLLAELGYATTMATAHMMFSFRSFTPYLPAAALILVEAVRLAWPAQSGRPRTRWIVLFVLGASTLHPAHAWITHSRSVNGLSPVGEYPATSVRDFDDFMRGLDEQAAAIASDWPSRPESRARALKLATYVGGLVPYRLHDAYIFELLASYRHRAPRYWNWSEYADYTMVLTPFFGTLEEQLTGGPARYEKIFERPVMLNGLSYRFAVYFNPAPAPHPLGDRIDRCCNPVP